MSLFKCKMCGGSLEVNAGESVVTCEYCGTQQTVPKVMDENLQNLFNRANILRITSEFDKAEKLYEKIIQADTAQSEAYWGLILCKYGIEYVDDPATFKKIPTCHRASYDSIIADDDYKSAIENADMSQRAIYEEQAKEIDRIQKEILALAQKEETYDVFICYKETDADGHRTQDSVIANDIYYQLTQEGFKVFYAAMTLEGKLGSAYEPIIFAALNSAKVMLSIGTKPEYFNAVWVKNEWSRFLKIIKKDRSKLLIPCYRDMDAYELPEEFAHLQAQDMAKIGFINDIVRGIKKVAKKDVPKQTTVVKETVVTTANAAIAPLLKRAFMFLEDGDFERADDFCEQVLNQDPENAQAYLGKLMSELRVKKQEALKEQAESFDDSNNYQKAVRFADEQLKTALIGYIEHINTRNESARIARIDGIYNQGVTMMENADCEDEYEKAAVVLQSISGYKDSNELVKKCYEKAEIARKEAEKRAKKIAIITTPIVCAIIAFFIVLNTVIIPNGKYNDAIALMDAGKYSEAILAFEALKGYKDSANKITECNTAILDGKYNDAIALMNAGKYSEAISAFEALKGYKDSADKVGFVYDKYKVEKLKVAKAGDYVFFGAYEQDNNTSNGKEDVEWLVLEVKDGRALLISKYALDCKQYNTSYTNVTWQNSTLRKWLNNDFINAAFSANEKAMIPPVTVLADKNPEYSTNPGNATQDQVFLLSSTEVNMYYFSSDSARQCKPTDYAVANGAYVNSSNGNCSWWLRSPGSDQGRAACVNYPGFVSEHGYGVIYGNCAVRPVLWIDLNS